MHTTKKENWKGIIEWKRWCWGIKWNEIEWMKCKYFSKNAFAAWKLITLREGNVEENAYTFGEVEAFGVKCEGLLSLGL